MGLMEVEAPAHRPRAEERVKPDGDAITGSDVVTFTSGDGQVFEIPDLPENLGRATALASERCLSKIWGTEEEAKACQDMFGERSS